MGKQREISRLSTLLGKILAYSVYQPYEGCGAEGGAGYVKLYGNPEPPATAAGFYAIDCEPGLENVRDIQAVDPAALVENAIEHGIKGQRKGA